MIRNQVTEHCHWDAPLGGQSPEVQTRFIRPAVVQLGAQDRPETTTMTAAAEFGVGVLLLDAAAAGFEERFLVRSGVPGRRVHESP